MPCNLSCKIVMASVLCFRPVDFQIVVLKDFFLPSVLFNLPEAYLFHLTSDHLFWVSRYQEFLLQKATKNHFGWEIYFKLKYNNDDMASSSKMSSCTIWCCRSFMWCLGTLTSSVVHQALHHSKPAFSLLHPPYPGNRCFSKVRKQPLFPITSPVSTSGPVGAINKAMPTGTVQ